MNGGRTVTKAIPLLIGIGLILSACAVGPDDGAPAYTYGEYADPIYGSVDFDYGGWGHGGWHHGWDHGHEDHGGHGFAHHASLGGHGGGGHVGGGGHGGGGHGGGGGGHR
jgi:hypothetical protein